MKKISKDFLPNLLAGLFVLAVVAGFFWMIWSFLHMSFSSAPAASNQAASVSPVAANSSSLPPTTPTNSAPAPTSTNPAPSADYTLTQNPDGSANVQLKTKDPFALSFPATLASPLTITLSGNQTVKITQQTPADFVVSSQDQVTNAIPNSQLASLIQENPILESYKSSVGQEEFYTYQKTTTQPEQKIFKNWIVFNAPPKTNQVVYEIQNATVNINSSGDAEIFASSAQKEGVSPDFVIPRPYFVDKNNQKTDLDWQYTKTTQLLTLTLNATPEQYPIALDPSVLKTNTVIATFSGKSISMDFQCGTDTVQGRFPDTTVYQTVLGEDGHCWLASNLGTPNIAASLTDSTAYGWYYQWGRLTDGHQIPTSTTTSTLSSTDNPGNSNFILSPNSPYDWRSPQNNNLWQGVYGVNNPCPTGWRLPTQTEWQNYVTAAGITNYTTAYASKLKLTAAGFRLGGSGGLNGRGSSGYYWSSSPGGTYAYNLYFYSSGVNPANGYNRADGLTVRCLKN